MKQIMESWRQFRGRVINESISDDQLTYNDDQLTYKVDPKTEKELLDLADDARKIASIADPTGVLSWPDVLPAIEAFSENPTLGNAGDLTIALISVVPLAGKLAAPLKIKKMASGAKQALPKVKVNFGPRVKNVAKSVDSKLAKIKTPQSRSLINTMRGKLKRTDMAVSAAKVSQALSPDEKYASIDTEKAEQKRSLEKAHDEKRELDRQNTYLKVIAKFLGWTGGRMSFRNLLQATQGARPGQGSKSQVFKTAKIVKWIGGGGFGEVYELDNGHLIKFFIDGVQGGLEGELKHYQSLARKQLEGTAKSSDLGIFEFGTIPLPKSTRPGGTATGAPEFVKRTPNLDPKATIKTTPKSALRPGAVGAYDRGNYLGYVEMSKVMSIDEWTRNKFGDISIPTLYGSKLNPISDALLDVIILLQDAASEGDLRPISKYGGKKKEYINYILRFIEAKLPKMAIQLQMGEGKTVLKSLIESTYNIAKQYDDDYLFRGSTEDVSPRNFGISYQTGEVVIFDR